jgi:hypothetical protein
MEQAHTQGLSSPVPSSDMGAIDRSIMVDCRDVRLLFIGPFPLFGDISLELAISGCSSGGVPGRTCSEWFCSGDRKGRYYYCFGTTDTIVSELTYVC